MKVWELNNTLLNNPWIKEEIKQEMQVSTNKNGNTTN